MKRAILILLAVCVVVGCVVGYVSYRGNLAEAEQAAQSAQAAAEAPAAEEPAAAETVIEADTAPGEDVEDTGIPRVRSLDYAAI